LYHDDNTDSGGRESGKREGTNTNSSSATSSSLTSSVTPSPLEEEGKEERGGRGEGLMGAGGVSRECTREMCEMRVKGKAISNTSRNFRMRLFSEGGTMDFNR
jgi:hypothetical protein